MIKQTIMHILKLDCYIYISLNIAKLAFVPSRKWWFPMTSMEKLHITFFFFLSSSSTSLFICSSPQLTLSLITTSSTLVQALTPLPMVWSLSECSLNIAKLAFIPSRKWWFPMTSMEKLHITFFFFLSSSSTSLFICSSPHLTLSLTSTSSTLVQALTPLSMAWSLSECELLLLFLLWSKQSGKGWQPVNGYFSPLSNSLNFQPRIILWVSNHCDQHQHNMLSFLLFLISQKPCQCSLWCSGFWVVIVVHPWISENLKLSG